MHNDDLLSRGMIAFVGIPGRLDSTPDEERVVRVTGDAGYDLIPRIKAILDELNRADPPLWNVASLDEMGRGVKAWLRTRHPELSGEAIDAVTNQFTYSWR
jgi:hypothetical protein